MSPKLSVFYYIILENTNNVPENALVGMNVLNTDKVFWYDEENSNKILASTDPLLLDKKTGDMKTTSGDIVAKAM